MTPKEKAIKLLSKYFSQISGIQISFISKNITCFNSTDSYYNSAKQCALIAVDEIDAAIDFDWMEVQNLDRVHNFWNEVKQEIEKL